MDVGRALVDTGIATVSQGARRARGGRISIPLPGGGVTEPGILKELGSQPWASRDAEGRPPAPRRAPRLEGARLLMRDVG